MTDETSFCSVDSETAQSQYSSWVSKQCETLDEYILRKRKIELNCLVKEVIENELSEEDRLIVKLHWYEGNNAMEVAKLLGVNKSTISRKLDKINTVVYNSLKYALEYRFGKDYSQDVKIIIKNKSALTCKVKPESTAQRIKNLRLDQAMTLKDVSDMTNLSEKHLDSIENAITDATATDLARIATAFRTSTDYIIFGKEERKCC